MKISKFVEVYSSHGLRLGIDSRSAGQRAIYFKNDWDNSYKLIIYINIIPVLCGVLRLIILATLFIFLINITIKYVMISKKQASQLPHVKISLFLKYFGITMSQKWR